MNKLQIYRIVRVNRKECTKSCIWGACSLRGAAVEKQLDWIQTTTYRNCALANKVREECKRRKVK